MEKLRIGIVGTNFVVDQFMNGIAMEGGCEVVSVCDVSETALQKFQEKYHIPHAFHDYHEMAEAGGIDAVYLAIPNALHHDASIYFLNKKLHVFCEKPMGANPQEVEQMFAAAEKNGVYLHDGIAPLYVENFVLMKKTLPQLGRIRRAVFVQGRYSTRYDAYLRGENPTTFRVELCNGSLYDMGVYCVALAVGLFGMPEKVFAEGTVLPSGADCIGTAVLTYADMEVVIMHSKVTDSMIESEIQGEQGNLFINLPSRVQELWLQLRNGERTPLGVKTDEGFKYELRDFRENIQKGNRESTLVPHSISRAIAQVLYECRRQTGIHYPCDDNGGQA